MLRSIFSILSILAGLYAGGQNKTASASPEEPERDWRPSMLRISYDFIPLGESVFTDTRSGQHVQASIDSYRYFFMVEYGTQQTTRGDGFDYQYENSGRYFRFGPEVNLLKNSTINTLNFGIRYAQCRFDDQLSFTKDSPTFGEVEIMERNNGVKVHWAELTAGLNVNVWKGLYMGYTVRYKFLRRIQGDDTLKPYDIPGFGLQENRLGVGFNYFMGWAFQLREKEDQIIQEKGIKE